MKTSGCRLIDSVLPLWCNFLIDWSLQPAVECRSEKYCGIFEKIPSIVKSSQSSQKLGAWNLDAWNFAGEGEKNTIEIHYFGSFAVLISNRRRIFIFPSEQSGYISLFCIVGFYG